jgi:hypothetical protein
VAFTSSYPLTFDGERLDTYAYSIETVSGRRTAPKQRFATVEIPGRDGAYIDFQDSFEPGLCVLKIWLIPVDVDGVTPASRRTQFEANLDYIMNLVGNARGRLIELRQTMGDASVRRTSAIVSEVATPEMFGPNSARMSIALTLPDSVWEDVSTADFTYSNAVTAGLTAVTTLRGGTTPTDNARFLITGPVTNPRLADSSSGEWIQLTQTVAAANMWLFDAGTRISRYGSGLTLSSADTAGADAWANTSFSGSFKMLSLRPKLASGFRDVKVTLTGTSTTAATAVGIRAKRKYL